jgi:hypothetical protein
MPCECFSLITIIFYRTEYHILIFTCVYGDIFFLTNCIVEYKITGWHLVFPMKMKRYIRDMTLTYSLVILQFKTNLMLNGVGGNPIEAKGIVSMELTVGRKSLATAFFIIEVQGNYSVILGCDWIHANCCIPSTLHQFLIQWIDDEIEVVHMDVSAYISSRCHGQLAAWEHLVLVGKRSYVSKETFVPVSVKPAFEARLGNVVFQ